MNFQTISLLKNSKSPSIVNIASRLGTRPCVEASAYCLAEAGIINFTRSKCIRTFKIFYKSKCSKPQFDNNTIIIRRMDRT